MKNTILKIMSVGLALALVSCGNGDYDDNSSQREKDKDSSILSSETDITSAEDNDSIGDSDEESESSSENETEFVGTPLNPFEKLKVDFFGSSPFLKVNLDTSKCSEEEQKYVKLTYDDIYYRIGDTVTVYAELNVDDIGANTYTLPVESKNFFVENTSEWLTSVDGLDLNVLNNEMADKLASETTETVGADRFGGQYFDYGERITSISEAKLVTSYFVNLKPTLYQDFDSDRDMFNCYIRLYNFDIKTEKGSEEKYSHTVTSCVIVKNIKKDVDGTLTYDPYLDYYSSLDNYDQLFNDIISSKRDQYVVTELS